MGTAPATGTPPAPPPHDADDVAHVALKQPLAIHGCGAGGAAGRRARAPGGVGVSGWARPTPGAWAHRQPRCYPRRRRAAPPAGAPRRPLISPSTPAARPRRHLDEGAGHAPSAPPSPPAADARAPDTNSSCGASGACEEWGMSGTMSGSASSGRGGSTEGGEDSPAAAAALREGFCPLAAARGGTAFAAFDDR
jgi:hypothetical protein